MKARYCRTCFPRVSTFLILARGLAKTRSVRTSQLRNAFSEIWYSFLVFADDSSEERQVRNESGRISATPRQPVSETMRRMRRADRPAFRRCISGNSERRGRHLLRLLPPNRRRRRATLALRVHSRKLARHQLDSFAKYFGGNWKRGENKVDATRAGCHRGTIEY